MGRVIYVNDTLVLFIATTMVLATDWEARIMEGCEEIGEVSIGLSMYQSSMNNMKGERYQESRLFMG